MTVDFHVTRRELVLGAQDTTTGWYQPSFVETVDWDKMAIVPKGYSLAQFGLGGYARYDTTGIHCGPLVEDDQVISNGKYYEVVTVEDVDLADGHMWYESELHERQMHWDMPTTYGTAASVDDPRKRTKVWLDTYLLAANLKENDGVTLASYITAWDGAPYNMKRVFKTKNVDLIFSVGKGTSEPVSSADKYVHGYIEKPTVTVNVLDKTTIAGENLMWQGERELRRIQETYPLGSLRNFESAKPKTVQLGSTTLYSVECTLEYARDKT